MTRSRPDHLDQFAREDPEPTELFSREEVETASRYNGPRYAAFLLDRALGLTVLAVVAFGPLGDPLYGTLVSLPWWAQGLAFPALAVALSVAVRLPLSFWIGYVREKRFGFSTQNVRGWLSDRAKALAVGLTLTSLVLLGLVGLARAMPEAWPAVAAPAVAALVLVLGFLAPVLVEPLFNRFTPLADEQLARELRGLATRAGVPVRDVLVADASRRTRKANAYVSGLGRTRRVVVYDTLLEGGEPSEIRLVAAHELGHRRMRHVAFATVLGMAGAVAAVLILWGLLQADGVLDALEAGGAGDPRVGPFVLLAVTVLELAALPVESALSRGWERDADRFSLELTGDLGAFERAHRALARSNLSDLDPPRALYLLLFSHPTPPERIAAARRLVPRAGPSR